MEKVERIYPLSPSPPENSVQAPKALAVLLLKLTVGKASVCTAYETLIDR